MQFMIGTSVSLFILYWWLLSKLAQQLLVGSRLKSGHWLLVGAINVCIIFTTYVLVESAILCYFVLTLLMLVEFLVFYRDKFFSALCCALVCTTHVLAIFMITISLYAMLTGTISYNILASDAFFLTCTPFALAALNVALLLVLRFIPLPEMKLINQHKEQQGFLIAWMTVNMLFLLYVESVFNNVSCPTDLLGAPIVACLTVLISLYIVLFFSITTSTLLGYKEKNHALEQAIHQEKQYRNSIVRDAIVSYEINVTTDRILRGFEELKLKLGKTELSYSEASELMVERLIHQEDVPEFIQTHTRENILKLFESGRREITTEYRRLLETGEYAWVRAITNMVQDVETGEVQAFIYIKNIDTEKKSQLDLQRMAECDPLTGLYNKTMTSKLIDEHLAFDQRMTSSALFMIDVDHFKMINDHFGHLYGDALLCELADKLVRIFRSSDIIGRIGGDEFMVLFKEGALESAVLERAESICDAFHATYMGNDGHKCTISSSIGIAFFPKDGTTFQELYTHADVALYAAKSSGKNAFRCYDGSGFTGCTAQRTEIQTMGALTQKGFRENRIEYIFKMLYQSESSFSAIRSALELVTRHFSFDRGYIFESSKDGKATSNTFEWCADGITPEIERLQNIPIDSVATANAHFQQDGTFILRSLDELPPMERAVLEPQGIKSMFQFGIFDKSRLLGFIGFDNCRNETVLSDMEIDEMRTICNILATFFVKQYVDDISAKDLLARQEVMNHLNSYIYVINPDSFEVLFMNDKIQKLVNSAVGTAACYNFFRGKRTQCADCPILKLQTSDAIRAVSEIYNDKLDIWMEVTASSLRWVDGTFAYLVNCTDITTQREQHQQHVLQLEQALCVDELTGCSTYHKFKQDAQRILLQQQDSAHFLVKLDVDNFKLINQIYGYQKGNEVLCCVAKAIEQTLRNKNEIFARVSKDEFIAMFTIQDNADIEVLYAIFLDNFNALIAKDITFKFMFPHGRYVIYPNTAQVFDIAEMFEKANVAHKAAKQDKTVEYAFYDDYMTKDALHIKEIENKMEAALEEGEFEIYLQPKYYLRNETVGGAEALTRWNNSNRDLFPPSAFISIFEQNGFITKLDFYVFTRVCHIIKDWIDAGIEPLVVSVNFSRLHLSNLNFVKDLCAIADRVGVDRRYLEIEITETVIYDNIDTLENWIEALHKDGFSMSMDDFGVGYSSLGMLKNLPVDVIKMDRSFFTNQRDVSRSKTVVRSIIQMAAGLGIRIVAEGVEDYAHVQFLQELDCDMVQGYYYAKPMPVEEFTQLIAPKIHSGSLH